MTYYEAALRTLEANEKHHERALAKLETQFLLKSGYCDELEDHVAIAVEMIAKAGDCSEVEAMILVVSEYELRQSRKEVTT